MTIFISDKVDFKAKKITRDNKNITSFLNGQFIKKT